MVMANCLKFIFGEFTNSFQTLLVFVPITSVTMLIRTNKNKWHEVTEDTLKKFLAYLIFIIIAVRIDDLVVNNLFNWVGSTQLLTTLGLVAKEIRQMLLNMEHLGYKAPSELLKRIDQLAGDEGEVYEEVIYPDKPLPISCQSDNCYLPETWTEFRQDLLGTSLTSDVPNKENKYSDDEIAIIEKLRRLRQIQEEVQETLKI